MRPHTRSEKELFEKNANLQNSAPIQPRKPIAKKRQKGNALQWWILAGVGIVSFACLSIIGYLLFQQTAFPPSAPTPLPVTATLPAVTSTPAYAPIFEPGECQFKKPEEAQVTCGYVKVPEDRNGNLGDTIQLAVAIYHSVSNSPKPDPTLFLYGTPDGQAISLSLSIFDTVIAPIIEERDFIAFDTRGTGRSIPAMVCDNILTTFQSDLNGELPVDQKAAYYQGAFATCKSNFNLMGITPSAYTSPNMAADARDVIRALGYQQANLYGVGYGTRIAQFVMREYPEIVRSAALDSVVPLDSQMLRVDISGEQNRLIGQLFAECAADPACSSAFPNLEGVYNEGIAILDAQPYPASAKIKSFDVFATYYSHDLDGAVFRDAVLWNMNDAQTRSDVPNFIYRVYNGDFSNVFDGVLPQFFMFQGWVEVGAYVATHCHDQVFANPIERLDATIFELCGMWDIAPPAEGENEALHSAIPTLILAGRYDTRTPAIFAHQLAERLTHEYLVEFPYEGYALTFNYYSYYENCPLIILASFLREPNAPPDMACMNGSNPIPFNVSQPPVSTSNLKPVMIQEYNLLAFVPPYWESSGIGQFINYPGEIPQIHIQRSPMSEAEWVEKLRADFLDGQGFDQPAEKVGDRQTAHLAWTLYRAASQGNPVDMAFAKHGSDTLMILLITRSSSHTHDYNQIFLPNVNELVPLD
ncbi:MAG: hypothetical protein DCC59_09485 [Chloroflexi bacterium]|nr:alpha/beta hydrolase [Anaerolineales bacterium]RIK52655.1 MAG: hypothetical protein DCC59_09485 [Chloroflexota bacterium]